MKKAGNRASNLAPRGKIATKPFGHMVPPKKATMMGAYQNLESLINEYANIEAPLCGFSSQQIYQKVFDCVKGEDLELLNSYITFHKGEVTEAFHKVLPKSLLHYAAKKGNTEILLAILRLNIPIDIVNNKMKTPMHKAWRNLEVVKILLSKGADPNAKNQDGKVPMHYAIRESSREDLVELVKLGFDIHARDNRGIMPIEMISNKEWIDALENSYCWQKCRGLLFVTRNKPGMWVGNLSQNLLREIANFL